MAVLTLNFIIRPMLVPPVETYMGNETIITKALPFPCWLPFDKQKHYEVSIYPSKKISEPLVFQCRGNIIPNVPEYSSFATRHKLQR